MKRERKILSGSLVGVAVCTLVWFVAASYLDSPANVEYYPEDQRQAREVGDNVTTTEESQTNSSLSTKQTLSLLSATPSAVMIVTQLPSSAVDSGPTDSSGSFSPEQSATATTTFLQQTLTIEPSATFLTPTSDPGSSDSLTLTPSLDSSLLDESINNVMMSSSFGSSSSLETTPAISSSLEAVHVTNGTVTLDSGVDRTSAAQFFSTSIHLQVLSSTMILGESETTLDVVSNPASTVDDTAGLALSVTPAANEVFSATLASSEIPIAPENPSSRLPFVPTTTGAQDFSTNVALSAAPSDSEGTLTEAYMSVALTETSILPMTLTESLDGSATPTLSMSPPAFQDSSISTSLPVIPTLSEDVSISPFLSVVPTEPQVISTMLLLSPSSTDSQYTSSSMRLSIDISDIPDSNSVSLLTANSRTLAIYSDLSLSPSTDIQVMTSGSPSSLLAPGVFSTLTDFVTPTISTTTLIVQPPLSPAPLPSISSSQPSTSVTQQSTLIVTQQSTLPIPQPTFVTQQSTFIMQPSTSITQQSTSVTQQSTSVTQQSTSVTQQSTSTTQQTTSTTQQTTSATQQSTSTTQQSTSTTQQSTSATQQSTSTTQQTTSATQQSTSTTQQSTSTTQQTTSATQQPDTTITQEQQGSSKDSLSLGGTVAIGIIIPLIIIAAVGAGAWCYHRNVRGKDRFKGYLSEGVRYKSYSNGAYKDDDFLEMGSVQHQALD